MADLIYAISVSLDGYIADEDGNIDWGQPSDDAHAFFNDLQRSTGTFLCGRRMYETMRVWDEFVLDELPAVQRDFAEAWRATDKVVFSKTLRAVTEPRTRLEHQFDAEMIRAMKDTADMDLAIAGAGLAAEAFREDLVDRYLMRTVPVVLGGGTPALPDGVRLDLALESISRFDDGSVLVEYRRAARPD